MSVLLVARTPAHQPAVPGPICIADDLPETLDLNGANPALLIPEDPRNPAQLEAARLAWAELLATHKEAAVLRLLLPERGQRLPLLLAASQAVRAQRPACRLYLGYQAEQEPILDDGAWGALDGGVLLPGDLGPEPSAWSRRLTEAQAWMPGRPWVLWADRDPGALAGVLLGDGARLVVPAGGAAARLAQHLPQGLLDIEGGQGDLTFTPRTDGGSVRWHFQQGTWIPGSLPLTRAEVTVVARDAYDVGALLARVRATQMRNRAALRTLEGRVTVDLHFQGSSGPGADLAYAYDFYQAAGEGEELMRKEIRFNGVHANVGATTPFNTVEARASLAFPAALAPTERFRYADGGPAGPGQRRLTFTPVDGDPALPEGFMVVDEGSGQILIQDMRRSRLPGRVSSVELRMTFGQVLPEVFIMTDCTSEERWVNLKGETNPVRRTVHYLDLHPNQAGFAERRDQARGSDAFMLKETVDGMRIFEKRAGGGRAVATKTSQWSRALLCGALRYPGNSGTATFPLVAFNAYNANLLNQGIQANFLVGGVANQVQVTVPSMPGGITASLNADSLLLKQTLLPIGHGHLLHHDGVGQTFETLNTMLGRDLGAGIRLGLEERLQWDRFSSVSTYGTSGFTLPPSGVTRETRARLTWQARGVQVQGFYGKGQRPEGTYGTDDELVAVPNQGRFTRWGGSFGYDLGLGKGALFHAEAGALGGDEFDRFKALDLSAAGDANVAGFAPYALNSDRTAYGKAALVLPPEWGFRLTVGLDYARIRALDDHQIYGFTGLRLAGDLPGFWKFTFVRVDLGVGLHSDINGVKMVLGSLALAKIF